MHLSSQSGLYHYIDESMYPADGVHVQGYGRADQQFGDQPHAQAEAAQKILDAMMPAREADGPAPEPALPDLEAAEQKLREAAAERHRALLFETLFGYQNLDAQY